jgi:bacterioferritin-associated ferredoxin
MALVCLCHGVNERRVTREIERGAATIEQIGAACDAGTCCRGCHATLDELLAERTCPSDLRPGITLGIV